MKADRGLTVERMVKLGRVSRSGFYRFQDAEPEPRSATWICATRFSGSRWNGPATGVHASPPNCGERGWRVNPKRVYRLMREDNLLCVRRAEVRGHDRFQPRAQGLSEPGAGHDPDRDRSALAGRYHLHPACATSSCSWP